MGAGCSNNGANLAGEDEKLPAIGTALEAVANNGGTDEAAGSGPSWKTARLPEHELTVITTDRDAFILSANPSCFRMLGWMEKDLIGKSIEDVFMPEKFHAMHKKLVGDYVTRTTWVPSVILDKARLLSIANKDGEIVQVVVHLTDLGVQENPKAVRFIATLKPHVPPGRSRPPPPMTGPPAGVANGSGGSSAPPGFPAGQLGGPPAQSSPAVPPPSGPHS